MTQEIELDLSLDPILGPATEFDGFPFVVQLGILAAQAQGARLHPAGPDCTCAHHRDVLGLVLEWPKRLKREPTVALLESLRAVGFQWHQRYAIWMEEIGECDPKPQARAAI